MPRSLDRPGQPNEPATQAHDAPARLPSHPTRPSSPPRPDRPEQLSPADRPAPTDQPAVWSRADLQHRLDRLPPGHPSSTREADASHDGLPDPQGLDHGRDDREREPDAPKHNYWTEVPRFLRNWADHLHGWPAERSSVALDRSHDPEGSWRGDGGQYLDPEQNAQAEDEIAMVQRTEGALTEQMCDAQQENAYGGRLVGLEFRRKAEDRLKEKIADHIETGAPDATVQQIVRDIPDAIRYTFCAPQENYTSAYWDIKERLEASGYDMYYSQNHWSSTQYKGINTRWITPEGQRFEVQFHTPESFDAKQEVTHPAYQRLRNALTTDAERRELLAFQREVCSWIPAPEGAADIPNYRQEDS